MITNEVRVLFCFTKLVLGKVGARIRPLSVDLVSYPLYLFIEILYLLFLCWLL